MLLVEYGQRAKMLKCHSTASKSQNLWNPLTGKKILKKQDIGVYCVIEYIKSDMCNKFASLCLLLYENTGFSNLDREQNCLNAILQLPNLKIYAIHLLENLFKARCKCKLCHRIYKKLYM